MARLRPADWRLLQGTSVDAGCVGDRRGWRPSGRGWRRDAVPDRRRVLHVPAQPARLRPRAAVARSAVGRRRRRLPARLDADDRPRPLVLQRPRPLRRDLERSVVPPPARGRHPVDRRPLTETGPRRHDITRTHEQRFVQHVVSNFSRSSDVKGHMPKRMLLTLILCSVPLTAQNRPAPSATEVAPGVIVFTTPSYGDVGLDGNSIAVLSRDGVLVFDTNGTPAASAAVLAQIRKRTDQPVRWIVNSHWHWDHWYGTETYQRAFPDLRIVAHEKTRALMMGPALEFNRPGIETQLPNYLKNLEQRAATNPALT